MQPLNQLERPFIIAEIGGNHEGDFEYAKKLLGDAIQAGADAIKFQTYSPDRIVSRVESPQRHKHFGKFALPIQQYVELAEICEEHRVQFMSSIWDLESIDILDPFIRVHKVGSGDLTNYRLLKPLAETGKPLCIATAMANMHEIQNTIDFIRGVNPTLVSGGNLCVMHCVAMYGDPRDEYANLRAITTLRDALPDAIAIGYSDHTNGNV
ncbi:MAG: N-acetylneuraminate synthase family protein, partial [Planctomycetota bacterium]